MGSLIVKKRTGHIQGYNAQVAFDADRKVIVAADITQEQNDVHHGEPMLMACEEDLGRVPKGATLKGRMERKLLTKKGRATYKERGTPFEPVFGQIKDARGFDSFLLRGPSNVRGEWNLMALIHNLLKLWRSGGLERPEHARGREC